MSARADSAVVETHPLRVPAHGRAWLLPVGIFLVWFATLLPLLTWMPFFNSIEDIVVATSLETRREGKWLIPEMRGEPRTRKPPLAAWLSALATRPQTVRDLDEPQRRESAYVDLALEMRLPALVASCLMLVATFELGRVVGGRSVGLCAAVIGGTNLLFLQHAWIALPDVQLALWVAVANVFLARTVLLGERWIGCVGAGAAIGLAMMSKGPVCLVQSVLPVLVFVFARAFLPLPVLRERAGVRVLFESQREPSPRPSPGVPGEGETRSWLAPILVGLLAMLAVCVPWYMMMLIKVPGIWHIWVSEVTRIDPADPRPDAWYANLKIFRHLLPWTIWLFVGGWAAVESLLRRHNQRVELAFWLLVVPLVVMSFFSERKDRYLYPVLPAASVVCACGVVEILRKPRGEQRVPDGLVRIIHWGTLAAVTIGWPVVGALAVRLLGEEQPRYASPVAVAAALAAAAVVGVGIALSLRRPFALVATTLVGMLLLLNPLFYWSYAVSETGQTMKPLADAIVRAAPNAEVFSMHSGGRGAPLDFVIYVNRAVDAVTSVDEIPPPRGSRPQVLVTAQRRGEPEPAPPAPWRPLAKTPRGDTVWHGFVR